MRRGLQTVSGGERADVLNQTACTSDATTPIKVKASCRNKHACAGHPASRAHRSKPACRETRRRTPASRPFVKATIGLQMGIVPEVPRDRDAGHQTIMSEAAICVVVTPPNAAYHYTCTVINSDSRMPLCASTIALRNHNGNLCLHTTRATTRCMRGRFANLIRHGDFIAAESHFNLLDTSN